MAQPNSLKLDQFALYKVTTRQRLAELLFVSAKQLRKLAEGHSYDLVEIIDKNGKPRTLQVPWGSLRDLHDRIQYLFSQLKNPSYLHSGWCPKVFSQLLSYQSGSFFLLRTKNERWRRQHSQSLMHVRWKHSHWKPTQHDPGLLDASPCIW